LPEVPDELRAQEPPKTIWKQVMATQRIGGRLTAVAVDQTNPTRIFVGTEEGTILRSLDGGITWIEFDITPFVRPRRTVGVLPPPKPSTDADSGGYFKMFIDPPNSRYLDRLAIPFDSEFFSVRPAFIRAGFFPSPPSYPNTFLTDVARERKASANPIGKISICPGGEFPLLISTKDEVYGSKDDGVTYIRLYAVVQPAIVYQVVCSKYNPNDITVGTFFGGFRSNDGGHTFDHLALGRGEARVTAATYSKPLPGSNSNLIAVAYDFAYQGDPDKLQNRLNFIYPEWANPETAPWTGIWWVTTDEKGHIYLATDDGVRMSQGADGLHWTVPARALFSATRVDQIEIGPNEAGGERVAVLGSNWIYASDDYGKSWFPFFIGETRRTVKQMAFAPAVPGVPPRWWVITHGGLFATVAPQKTGGALVDEEAARWAKKQLQTTPPLHVVMNKSLSETKLAGSDLENRYERMRARNFLPRVDMNLSLYTQAKRSLAQQVGTETYNFSEEMNRTQFEFFIQGIWEFRDVRSVIEEYSSVRNAMHSLRWYQSYIVEDVWHERWLILNQLAEGIDDRLQVAILKERISSLEAVLEVWLGQTLKELYFDMKGKRGEG